MRKLAVFILLFVSLSYITCSSFYVAYSNAQNELGKPLDYQGWRDFAWKQTNINGVCAHLATYETQFEFEQIISSIKTDAASKNINIIQTYFGAQKDENSNLFYWAVGSRRGQAYFSASIIPKDSSSRFLDINFENGFICHQEYCFDKELYKGSLQLDTLTNSVVYITNIATGSTAIYSDNLGIANYGVAEYESSAIFANANGGSKFIVSKSFVSFTDANIEANIAGLYVARIESDKQQQWILDELQCTTDSFWIGYQLDTATNDYIKSPGPGEGQTLYDSVTGCVKDLFCKYEPTITKRSVTELPGIVPPSGLALDLSQAGKWISIESLSSTHRYLSQAEFCSYNADQFFRHNFKLDYQVRVCLPNPSNNWIASTNSIDGRHGYFTEKTFLAGAGVYFTNLENDAKKLLYFDCDCNTNPIIDKACLGSSDFPDCVLYTNNALYYQLELYFDRMYNGLAFSLERLTNYLAWYDIYHM